VDTDHFVRHIILFTVYDCSETTTQRGEREMGGGGGNIVGVFTLIHNI